MRNREGEIYCVRCEMYCISAADAEGNTRVRELMWWLCFPPSTDHFSTAPAAVYHCQQ